MNAMHRFPSSKGRSVAALKAGTALAVAVLLASGCATPPSASVRPAMDLPARYAGSGPFQPANPSAADVPDAWWTLFNDPVDRKSVV